MKLVRVARLLPTTLVPATSPPASLRRAGLLIFLLPYVLALTCFQGLDVYHNRFYHAGHGGAYRAYNLSRVLFIVYLAWSLYFVGRVSLRWAERRWGRLDLGLLEQFVLCFYVGSAVATGALFVLGFCNLYYYGVLMPLGLLVVAASYPEAVRVGVRAVAGVRWHWAGDRNHLRLALRLGALVAVAGLATLVVVVKALPPGGGGDYFTHYFPYFRHVLINHGLWPNDVWYHFYVSKGATLVFYSAVVTDLQAPELVTCCFVFAAALALYSSVRRFANNGLLPLAAVAAYLASFVHTVGVGPFAGVEWGQFQKHHEHTASLVAGVAWACIFFCDRTSGRSWVWTAAAATMTAGAVLYAPTIFPLLAILIGSVVAAAVVGRRWRAAGQWVLVGAAGGVTLAGLMGLNYALTGMAEITPFRPFWQLADQQRFSAWVSPYLMTLLEEGSAPGMGDVQVIPVEKGARLEFVSHVIRASAARVFFPAILVPAWCLVLGLVSGVSLLLARGRRTRLPFSRALVPVLGTLAGAVVLSQIANQPVSVYRYFSFCIFFVVLAAVLGWALLFRLAPSRRMVGLTSYAVPALLTAGAVGHGFGAVPTAEYERCVGFALGRHSLSEGYHHHRAINWPEHNARAEMDRPDGRLYSFNLNAYSMAPGHELETFVSFSLKRDWHTVMFEEPEAAREALRRQGLNYFLIDFDQGVLDVIQYSPLFRPDSVGQYLKVIWNERNAYLLTWAGPGDTETLPPEFREQYHDEYFEKMLNLEPLYRQVRHIYQANRDRPYPIRRDPNLPHIKGWQ